MNIQNQIQQMIDGLIAQGIPTTYAVALATSIEHSIQSEDYAKQYGTFMVDALIDMVSKALP